MSSLHRAMLPAALVVATSAAVGCSSTKLARGDQRGDRVVRGSKPCNCASDTGASEPTGSLWQKPRAGASERFWKHWGDGRAELSGYRIVTSRYGEQRTGHVALIYVTEALDRATLIKDDREALPEERRLHVLKLNQMLKFTTGIYPYSVMTSVFAPVADYGLPRFTPAKVAFSVQEWCGHVYQQLRPGRETLQSSIRSYFASEGETDQALDVPAGALYEDALLIQLRGLDGPFNGGKPWSGRLVPSLWRVRKAHLPLGAVAAKVSVVQATRGEVPVWRYTLEFAATSKVYEVEQAFPHRVLGWSETGQEEATLLKTARLPYWQLNRVGDERHREQLGLP